ncbi:MAG: Tad domain-containing protein [Nitrospira sp.]
MSRHTAEAAWTRSSWRSDRGAVTVVVAVAMTALFLIGAVVVDIGVALVARHHAQTVVDAAALAGARQLGGVYERAASTIPTRVLSGVDRTRLLRAAAQVAELNRINLTTLTLAELRIGSWNPASQSIVSTNVGADALLVRAAGQTPTFLAGLLGIRQLDIAASATAALTPLGEVPLGGLPAPVGIASGFIAQGPIDGKRVVFYQAGSPGPCTGWTTFTQAPATVAGLQTLLSGLTTGGMSSPVATASRSRFQFVRGNLAALFPQIKALFDAKKDPATGQWVTVVPIYEQRACQAPSGSLRIAGFSTAVITLVSTPNGPVLEGVLRSGSVAIGRGGGPDYGTKGSVPGLVS